MELDLHKLRNKYKLNDSESMVLDYIVKDLDSCLKKGIRDIAKENYCSTTVITNLSKKMGYKGFIDLIYNLKFEILNKITDKKTEDLKKFRFIDTQDKMELYYKNIENFEKFKILLEENKAFPIYCFGTIFSRTIAEYMKLKLSAMGYISIFSEQHQHYDINPINGKILLIVSRSGETSQALTNLKKARNSGIKIVSFTGDVKNSIGESSDINFQIPNLNRLDDRNIEPNSFFSDAILIFEMLCETLK